MAEKVYSILHLEGFPQNSLYNTQYPRYAAIIGTRASACGWSGRPWKT